MKKLAESSVVVFLMVVLGGFGFHDYHVSLTQLQHNVGEKTIEISMRVFTDDLETALSRANGNKKLIITNEDRNGEFLKRYLLGHFQIKDGKKQILNFTYLGKEQEVEATWIYLEIPGVSTLSGATLKNDVLMEVFDDQVNMVNFKSESGKKTYLFKKGSYQHNL